MWLIPPSISFKDDNERLRLQNLLTKKVKDLEVLGRSLLLREEEVLAKYQDRLEEEDLEENTQLYEKKGLLCGSSDDEDDQEECKGKPLSGKDFGVIDWGDEDDQDED